jgi:hypothetical protein
MLLQLAAQDIGQLTDIEPRRVSPPVVCLPWPPGSPEGGDSALAAWSVCIGQRVAGGHAVELG